MTNQEIRLQNEMTSSKARKRRALERLHFRHAFKANTYQDATGQHRRMAERYRQELQRVGAV